MSDILVQNGNSLEEKKGSTLKMSAKSLQEMIRPHVVDAIIATVELLNCPNENVRLGAAKLLMSKVLPDLKATELTGDIALTLKSIIKVPVKEVIQPPDTKIVEAEHGSTN